MSEEDVEVLKPHDETHRTYILVTGANSGLGFAVCQRLIDEFVRNRPPYQSLTLIPTTRDEKKAQQTVARLEKHLSKLDERWEENLSNRVNIQPEQVDLTSLRSVRALAATLLNKIPQLDAIICNAGFGGVTGLNWPLCLWSLLMDFKTAVTYAPYKIGEIGLITAPQIPSSSAHTADSKISPNDHAALPQENIDLGKVFTSNVFGHYLLTHFLLSLLSLSPDAGRVIWVSSIEGLPNSFKPDDLQGLTTDKAYESSKRLTDILILTSALPPTAPFVKRFLTPPTSTPIQGGGGEEGLVKIELQDNDEVDEKDEPPRIILADRSFPSISTSTSDKNHDINNPDLARPPTFYLTHPGICASNFIPLPYLLQLSMALAFLLARWLGSPWHTVSTYKGAKAPVWLALAAKEEVEDAEVEGGRGKWGSCVDRLGREGVKRTPVVGWGVGGMVGEKSGDDSGGAGEVGRERDEVATREEREEFEVLGRGCWREMETLRVAWEERLRGFE